MTLGLHGLTHLPWRSPAAGSSRPCIRDVYRELSYADVEQAAVAFAEQLGGLGVGRGDVVAIMLPNSVDFVIALLGAWRVGAAVTPLNPTFTLREAAHQLTDSGARLVVGHVPCGVDVPVLDVADMQRHPATRPAPDLSTPDEIALVIYTSGSTGLPKGVLLDHANLEAMAGQLAAHFALTADDHALLTLPLFHVNALCVSLLACLRTGAQVTILERFQIDAFVDAIRRHRPTYFSGVPAVFARIVALPDDVQVDAASLRFALCGASPVSKELLERAESRLGIRLIEGYGLTEATCASAIGPLEGVRKLGTVGPALAGQRIRTVDPEGRDVPIGERGEVLIGGPTVMRGYLGRPDATASTLADGWVRTGDIGVLDEDGYLRIVDRVKDMIIRGGENIYPKEIESVLAAHPGVLESAVVGRPDPVLGEVPVASVVTVPGATVTADDLLVHCGRELAKIKVPVAIDLVDALPRNPVGKIDKPALRRAFAPEPAHT